ncbi:MAG: hypothetical protein H5T71_02055 [Chloroflexi bacterium]|nr:hypothetical protein [Chloroflexota bacterium]MBC7257264.1 hypothetical protein [Chloroflexota bacterium]
MLFDVVTDPHELHDLAAERPDIVHEGLARLEAWHADMMAYSPRDTDPLWTVMREGGPYHTRGFLERYVERLRASGRAHHAERLLEKHRPRA